MRDVIIYIILNSMDKTKTNNSSVLFFKNDIRVERVVESSAQANVFFGRETSTGVKVVVK